MTMRVGASQMGRVVSTRSAAIEGRNEGRAPQGSVMASDAFFPFPDCVEIAWSPEPPAITISPVASSSIATLGPLLLPLSMTLIIDEAVRKSRPPRMTTLPPPVPKTLPKSSKVNAPLASMDAPERSTWPIWRKSWRA